MENINERYLDSLASKFNNSKRAGCLILKSPSDIGVRRNKGRNGARFAPQAIENVFKKMNNHLEIDSFRSETVSSQSEERADYIQAMNNSAKKIGFFLQGQSIPSIHLGGGHDHAFPLLNALDQKSKNILIVNFDAHCDTRTDLEPHSGTPFRNFDDHSQSPFHLVQVGIHPYANNKKTLRPLKRNTMDIVYSDHVHQVEKTEQFIDRVFSNCPFAIDQNTTLFISLDCDAIASSVMSAVSAVNHHGLSPDNLLQWIETLKAFPCSKKILGIYEYNPVYEDLSQKGARYLAGLMYQFLR